MRRAPLTHALTVADWVARHGDSATGAVAEALSGIRQRGVRERALARLAAGRVGAQSPAESGSRAVMLAAGFPEPELQHRFADANGLIGYGDFWWPSCRLLGEVDGLAKYRDPAMTGGLEPLNVLVAEKQRENRLFALGIQIRRWMWSDIVQRQRLVALLESAGLPRNAALRLH